MNIVTFFVVCVRSKVTLQTLPTGPHRSRDGAVVIDGIIRAIEDQGRAAWGPAAAKTRHPHPIAGFGKSNACCRRPGAGSPSRPWLSQHGLPERPARYPLSLENDRQSREKAKGQHHGAASPRPDESTGYWISQALYVAAKLGLADLVKDGPRSAEALAQTTGTHAGALYRLLRALASIGCFAEDAEHRFRLTPLAECLCGDLPGSQRALAIMASEEHYRAYGELLYSIQTGKTGFDHVYGMPVFDYLSRHPEQARLFDQASACTVARRPP
jgi:hypothetical protein